MSVNSSPITPTAHPALEQALRDKLRRRSDTSGSLGELEPLALRLGLIQHSLKPRLLDPQIAFFAADHGLAVDGIGIGVGTQRPSTAWVVNALLTAQLPVAVFARLHGLELSVVDCGVAEAVAPHARLMARKIAHGTRNARVASAMSLDQAHAGIRAGMEIADTLPGNAVVCAGVGVGASESASLLLSSLANVDLRQLLISDPAMSPADLAHRLSVLQGARARHKNLLDPVELMAAFGGFETAMMVGVMLVAASKRNLVVIDGMAACAALMVAARIAPHITDYCAFSRSHGHAGMQRALGLFKAAALLELGIESADGTGAALAWPLVRSAAALLNEAADGQDPGPTLPDELAPLPGKPFSVPPFSGPAFPSHRS